MSYIEYTLNRTEMDTKKKRVPGLWRYCPRLRLLTVMSITGEKRFVDIPELGYTSTAAV
jgi:hypothetical protein